MTGFSLLTLLFACAPPEEQELLEWRPQREDPGIRGAEEATDSLVPRGQCSAGSVQAPAVVDAHVVDLVEAGLASPVHMTDVSVGRDLAFMGGLGGTVALDPDGRVVAVRTGDVAHVAAASDTQLVVNDGEATVTWLALTSRGFTQTASLALDVPAGMAWGEGLLYVAQSNGGLASIRSVPGEVPEVLEQIVGLANPKAVVLADDVLYVADTRAGLWVFDLHDELPVLRGMSPTHGSAQDVVVVGDHAYVAVASGGLEVFELTAGIPRSHARVALGGNVVSVDYSDDVLWASTPDEVFALDLVEPGAPAVVGRLPAVDFTLAVGAADGRAWVADWEQARSLEVEREHSAADAELSAEVVYLKGGEAQEVVLRNRGRAPLELFAWGSTHSSVTLELPADAILPGDAASMVVRVGEGEMEADICVVTNDPNQPVQWVTVRRIDGLETGVGEVALDFTLNDLDEQPHTLSERQGSPVLLAYFATW